MFSKVSLVIPKNIKIYSKRLTQEAIYGGYKSAFKGAGMELRHIRDYQAGDDVRNIDWKSSAKIDKLMTKEFDSERDRVLLVVTDFCPTTQYGSGPILKSDMILHFALSIAHLANNCGDRTGFLLPTTPLSYMHPEKGQSHIAKFLNKVLGTFTGSIETDFSGAIEFVSRATFSNYVVFFVSDWLQELSAQALKFLKICAKKQEVIAVRVLDKNERAFPRVGMLPVKSFDQGELFRINFCNNQINKILKERLETQNRFFDSLGIDRLDLDPEENLERNLVSFFRKRKIRK